jgi:hypothetical protein
VKLWWRDDDAGADDPKLDRLLAIAMHRAVPVVLAVIPARLDGATAQKILACPFATAVQHGLAHKDHRSVDGQKCELVDRIDQDAPLVAARHRLADTFGERFRPMMVPPWNRIEPALRERLPALEFPFLSTFAGHRRLPPAEGLRQLDTHVDAIRWKEGRAPLDSGSIVAACRQSAGMVGGPIGLLTHHAVTDEEGFRALDRAIGLLQDRHEAEFLSLDDALKE